MNKTVLGEILIGDSDGWVLSEMNKKMKRKRTVFAHQGHQRSIGTPYHIFDWWAVKFCEGLLLLNVVEYG